MTHFRSFFTLIVAAVILSAAVLGCKNAGGAETTNIATSSQNTSPSAPSTTAPTASKDISGDYDVTGTNVDGGSNYKASLTVKQHDEVYQFSWNSGGRTYDGVGVMAGDSVAVSFTEGSDGDGCGVVLYTINSDGSLDGKAGYWGVDTAETEQGTRKSGTGFEGKYDITGTTPNGSDYKGTLDINAAGKGYSFKWNTGSTLSGFGLKHRDQAAAGFGGKQCSFVVYGVKPDGTLEGAWGGLTSTSLGTEVATKK
jgi:hypothetical protein